MNRGIVKSLVFSLPHASVFGLPGSNEKNIVPPTPDALLLEDGSYYLQEDGTSLFLLE